MSAGAKWTLAACRERAKGDTYETASEHIAKAFVDRAKLLALVKRMRPHLDHALLCAKIQSRSEEGYPPMACDCGLAALLREIEGGDPR